jgi:hypothetical protein
MKHVVCAVALVAVLGGGADPGAAQEEDSLSMEAEAEALGLAAPEDTGGGVALTSSPESLVGLKRVCLVVQDLNPELEENGLSRRRIYLHVAMTLVRAGITVISSDRYEPGEGTPFLNVYVQALNTNGVAFAYNLGLSLSHDVTLLRDPAIVVAGSTWRSEELGIVPAGRVRDLDDSIRSKAEQFVADYLAVNGG